jgi:hypothetical protein
MKDKDQYEKHPDEGEEGAPGVGSVLNKGKGIS